MLRYRSFELLWKHLIHTVGVSHDIQCVEKQTHTETNYKNMVVWLAALLTLTQTPRTAVHKKYSVVKSAFLKNTN